jgi:uncharacterized SAM-binding protein YcdF (DUF218 family)
MMFSLSYGFLAPPAVLMTLCLAGALLALLRRRAGLALTFVASLVLCLSASAALSSWLLRQVESELPDNVDLAGAQAIVVLGGDIHFGDRPEPDTLGPMSLERVVFAAAAYRRLRLPVAVSGGGVPGSRASAGDLMKAALEQDFGVPVSWDENQSRTTYENALYTARLLQPANITTVVVVTHSWHLPRALWSFERVGLHALPWPAPRTALRTDGIDDFLPSVGGLRDGFYALHEGIGSLYYRLRY